MSTTPTQVARPGRTAIRSAIQVAIPTVIVLGLVVPEVVSIILEETGETMPAGVRAVLLAASAVVVAIAAIITRVMAIPQVDAWLESHARALAADPSEEEPGQHRRGPDNPPDAGDAPQGY